MSQASQHLSGYSLKLSSEDRRKIKSAAASGYNYLYEWCDEAVQWAADNKESIRPIANKKDGSYRSYYLSQTNDQLAQLESYWGVSATRALYTAVIGFLNQQEQDALKAAASG